MCCGGHLTTCESQDKASLDSGLIRTGAVHGKINLVLYWFYTESVWLLVLQCRFFEKKSEEHRSNADDQARQERQGDQTDE